MDKIIKALLQISATEIVASLTILTVIFACFFIALFLIIINNRKDSDLRHKHLSQKIDNMEKLLIVEYKNIVNAVKDLKI